MTESASNINGGPWTASVRSVIVATHYWSPGWASAFNDFLARRPVSFRMILHPLFADGSRASYKSWHDGVKNRSLEADGIRNPSRYLADLTRTIEWSRLEGPADLFVAGDNLLAVAGLWLRRRSHVKAVVLYSIDFVPRRFVNPAANALYRSIDRTAVKRADVVWNAASGVIEGRRQRDGVRRAAPQLVVPIGAHTRRIEERSAGQRKRHVVYLGHLLEKQGLQVVIQALPSLLKTIPDVQLLVIGDGPYRPQLESLASNLGVSQAVAFAGFGDDHVAIERRLLDCAIGVAPYMPDQGNYSAYQDLPGKIVTYLACGLPVITTSVPRHGYKLEAAGAGRVVDYRPAAITSAIANYLEAPELLDVASKAARRMSLSYDWDNVFERALEETVRASPALGRQHV